MSAKPKPPEDWIAQAAWLAALATLAFFISINLADFQMLLIDGRKYFHTADDHMITQRVARNFEAFGAPYFNQGEAVAANTSLIWPIILSGLYLALEHQRAVAALIICSAFAVALTATLAATMAKGRAAQAAVLVAVSCAPSVVAYGATGWEHVPQTLLITAAFAVMRRRNDAFEIPRRSLLLLGLAFLLRIDAAPIIAVVYTVWFLSKGRYARGDTYAFLALMLIFPALYFSLMHHYYGAFFPNTAALKVQGGWEALHSGALYLLDPRESGAAPLLLLALLALRPRMALSRLIAAAAAAQMAYVLLIGGDVFGNGRFLMLIAPPLIAALTVEGLTRLPAAWGKAAPLAALLLFALMTMPGFLKARVSPDLSTLDHVIADHLRIMHQVNRRLSPEDGSIGLHYLGFGYHSPEFHVVDFLGKADAHIAALEPKGAIIGHNKWDYDYSFAQHDIAIAPITNLAVEDIRRGERSPHLSDFPFWWEMAERLESDDRYVYLPPKALGNAILGAFLRRDLEARFP